LTAPTPAPAGPGDHAHADDDTAEEIANEIYPSVSADVVCRVIAFALTHVGAPI